MKKWGFHLIADCGSCKAGAVTDKSNIENFTKELVKRIDMEAYGDPQIPYFAEHDPEKAGFSLVQLITTSAITGHFVDKTNDAYLDIFSCKPFSKEDALAVIKQYFAPEFISVSYVNRQAPHSKEEELDDTNLKQDFENLKERYEKLHKQHVNLQLKFTR
jgi:S-adenosylmethionine/arginine decarboxylase-like enzyme